jgi:hypothetical protein
MATTFKLNPDRVAYFEAAGWRAYYDHKWIKMHRLITSGGIVREICRKVQPVQHQIVFQHTCEVLHTPV